MRAIHTDAHSDVKDPQFSQASDTILNDWYRCYRIFLWGSCSPLKAQLQTSKSVKGSISIIHWVDDICGFIQRILKDCRSCMEEEDFM